MQTKFASIRCSCEEKFDSQERIPMKLPCGHNLCYYCIIDQHREKKHIICQQCQATYKINPRNFEQDEAFLVALDKLEKQQEQLEQELGQIQETQSQIKMLRQERNKKSSNASQRLIQKLMQVLWVMDFVIKEQFRQDEMETANTSKMIQNLMNQEESKLELATHLIQEASSSSLKLEQNLQKEKELTRKAGNAINKMENEMNTILDQFQLNEIQKIFQAQEQKSSQQELEERIALQHRQEERLKEQQEKKRVQAWKKKQKKKQKKEQERKMQEEEEKLVKQKEAEKQKEIQQQQKQEQVQGCQVKSPWYGQCSNESKIVCVKCQKNGCGSCFVSYWNCETCNKKGDFCNPCYQECDGMDHQFN